MNERSSEIFLIELPKPKSLEVLASFNNDYFQLVEYLDIKKNRLVILNPGKVKKGTLSRIRPNMSQTQINA